ncbi:MAG: hypothetical protein NC078_09795 [Ruminococcus sp.]|nr:hypothetical protein [Ruminococcus sp.]
MGDNMIEDKIREKVCEENRRRMRTVKNNFTVTRIYNVYLGFPLALISLLLLVGWIMTTGTGIRKSLVMLEETPEPVYFPWFAVTAFLVPFIAVLSFLADSKPKRVFSLAAFLLHLCILAFAAANLIFKLEPMQLSHMIFLAVYGFLGMWSEDFALRSYKELEYLVTQEGFPDFNFNLEQGRYSRYVKYRNEWLKRQKKQDNRVLSPKERPTEKAVTTKAESENEMEGISVSEADKSGWFEEMENVPNVPREPVFDPVPKAESPDGEPPGDMNEIVTEGGGIVPDELIDDPRRRPL